MAEEIPSAEEIMALAQEVYENAVQRRAFDLKWAAEGKYDQYKQTGGGLQYVSGGTNEDWAKLREDYKWRIVDLFDSALSLGAEPNGFGSLLVQMEQAEAKLAGASGNTLQTAEVGDGNKIKGRAVSLTEDGDFQADVNHANIRLSAWHGDAADLFRKNFLDQLTPVKANQVVLFGCMRSSLAATQYVYAQYRRDLKEIAVKAKAALHPAGAFEGVSLKVALGIGYKLFVSAVGLAEAIKSPTPVGVGLAVIDFGMNISELLPKPSDDKFAISGVDAEKAVQTIGQLIYQVSTWLDEREAEVIDVLDKNLAAVSGSSHKYFEAYRPTETIELSRKPASEMWNQFD